MKFVLSLLASISLMPAATFAAWQPVPCISAVNASEDGSNLNIEYVIDRAALHIPSNSEVTLTPVLLIPGDSIVLPQVLLAGNKAYLSHLRNDDIPKTADLVRAKGEPLSRSVTIPFSDAMYDSELVFRTQTRGCRCRLEGSGSLPESFALNLIPDIEFIFPREQLAALEAPVTELVKVREIKKTAHVNYKLASTILLPDYKDNPAELAAITSTIDSVRDDRDLTVRSVALHGFASPEGNYELNTRLAKGRTEALRQFVDKQYGFGNLLFTEWTPEDWYGLQQWVNASSLKNKSAILAIIDSDLSPDAKDAKINRLYPADYAILLRDVYPSLRRCDYNIEYTVRTYTDPSEIADKLRNDPTKLSMEEVMLLARTYPEGSQERDDLILKAAEIFPTDPRLQINGAFIALQRRDLDAAGRMLDRCDDALRVLSATDADSAVGSSFSGLRDSILPLATYARGLHALYSQDWTTARPLLKRAAAAGLGHL